MADRAQHLYDCPALATDLYQLTMAQAYWHRDMYEPAVFDLFVRELPAGRGFLIAAGLEQALEALEAFRFHQPELDYLATLGLFRQEFLDYLAQLRFHGEVRAVPEGTPVFPDEPLLEVCAPLPQAQLVETCLINQLQLPTLVASKAAMLVAAAAGHAVVDFGLRRAHGIEAGVKAARAAYISGVASTSDLLAGSSFDIPVAGTMAHSYVLAHTDELESFRYFTELYPQTVLLVDTFDTLAGVEKVISLARELGERFQVRAIRIDSGDLGELARQARVMLDRAGLWNVAIFVSGDLDVASVAELVRKDAPVDGFGIGTHLVTSADAPFLNCAYKLVEYAGIPRMKLSSGKATLPGAKQVFRRTVEAQAHYESDLIARRDEDQPGRPLLQPVMQQGRRLPGASPALDQVRAYCRGQLAELPSCLLSAECRYPVNASADLEAETRRLSRRLQGETQ
jgi:nicotinate phosphoribosyltransferase